MPNIENLKYKDGERYVFTQEDTKKGQEASARARAKKKSMKEQLELLFSLPIKSDKVKAQLKELGIEDSEMNNQMALLIAMYQKALKGDVNAFNSLRDSSGNKPVEQIQHSGEINNPYTNLTEEELHKLAGE